MNTTITSRAHAEADTAAGSLLATVRLPASPERVFRAFTSDDIVDWWVRPGVFDTRTWAGDVRPGGAWRTTGVGGGAPYALEGEYVTIDAPQHLAFTWRVSGAPGETMVECALAPSDGGTFLTLSHSGFTRPDRCESTAESWRVTFERLAELLAAEHG
jgi:uncharacterized protein YndB with AHSA1/START domain